ncbi:hypothetical protein K491DRAFT_65857 [Lophiostoma macrostomum CBS 122681]|uniref:Uncharacterized protein n=1 Tax=Lophiostoma macrostomum CBS 122681 TaxID=1314788 RepID=A0A6A6SWV4_9PLEO|nr:hypothetical protein K491DRAFT_65857 [Lophiostoma macrostomum CBS 122681]
MAGGSRWGESRVERRRSLGGSALRANAVTLGNGQRQTGAKRASTAIERCAAGTFEPQMPDQEQEARRCSLAERRLVFRVVRVRAGDGMSRGRAAGCTQDAAAGPTEPGDYQAQTRWDGKHGGKGATGNGGREPERWAGNLAWVRCAYTVFQAFQGSLADE